MTSNVLASLLLILQTAVAPIFIIVLIVFLERALRHLLPLIAGEAPREAQHD
ncbi:hypothetical protein [Agrococcus casei]|uniref:Uncharacterized protein n=1 Tax=Agrococcus casei LMG 22410 TaxID=1255656 RepID=A0A1R4EW21_9MICO|nr:hypothetical protein [Agrococcus casei]SJM47877.1 hypothetical protein CZ674_01285 [Agrococcus casei LMG 22410]